MSSDEAARLRQRGDLLISLRETRKIFARAGDVRGAMRIELGIHLLLDQRVSDRMIELLTHSAAIAARDAADPVTVGPA